MHRTTGLLATFITLVLSSSAQAAGYVLHVLDTSPATTRAYAVNASGAVVGASVHATLWQGGVATDLGTVAGPASQAFGINASGTVVGFSTYDESALGVHAALWDASGAHDLGTLPGGGDSYAVSINDAGVIVGHARNDLGQDRAVMWTAGGIVDLGTLGGSYGNANYVTNGGTVVGTAYLVGDANYHAVRWEGGAITDLDAPGSDLKTAATGANDAGQIVGNGFDPSSSRLRALLWDSGGVHELPLLGGSWGSASAVNDAGDIVGESEDGSFRLRATLWRNGIAIDLNTYLDPALAADGWILGIANGISDSGEIAGVIFDRMQNEHAFVLTPEPVPLPAAVWGFVAALAALRSQGRRG